MNPVSIFLFGIMLLLGSSGCSDTPKEKLALHEVHWDRDMCERCKMVTSDRHHAVQAINPQTGRSYMFDDIGCLLLWFDEEQIPWSDQAKIWITDVKTGRWIDARTAYYGSHNITPMAYGFAAYGNKEDIKAGEAVFRYEDLLDKVIAIEKKINKNYRGPSK